MTNNKTEGVRIGEDNICPLTKEPCLDECCPPGAICNLSGNLGQDACKPESLPSPPPGVEQRAKGGIWVKADFDKFQGNFSDHHWRFADTKTPASPDEVSKIVRKYYQGDLNNIEILDETQSIAGSESQGWEDKQWRPGVKVKITACTSGHEFEIGDVVTIVEWEEDSWRCIDSKGKEWYVDTHEGELV